MKDGLGLVIALVLVLAGPAATWILGKNYWNEFLSPWWEGRIQNRYLPTQAFVRKTWPEEYDHTRGKYSTAGHRGYLAKVQYEYVVNATRFSGTFSAQRFHQGKPSQAQAFLDAHFPAGKELQVLRHPERPELSVATRDDLPTLAVGIGTGFFTLVPLAAFLVISAYSLYALVARSPA